MSDSLAILRARASADLRALAKDHLKHDLRDDDRDCLQKAARKMSTQTVVGSLIGMALGAAMAFRVRSLRVQAFKAFRAAEKPTFVKFADGREEAIPDITHLMEPTKFGDIATYCFFTLGGLFVGGELGLMTGSWTARRTLTRDPESKARIEQAWRGFRADVLRRELESLEGQDKPFNVW